MCSWLGLIHSFSKHPLIDHKSVYDYHVLFHFSPRSLDQLEGHDLENITALRNLDEAHLVAEQGKGKNVVVIGTSFIGRSIL